MHILYLYLLEPCVDHLTYVACIYSLVLERNFAMAMISVYFSSKCFLWMVKFHLLNDN